MQEKLRTHLADKAKEIRVKVPDQIPEKAPGGRAALGAAALAMALVLGVGITVPLFSGDDEGASAITEIAAPDTTAGLETTTSTTLDIPPPTGADIDRPGELPAVIEGPRLVWEEVDFDFSFVRSMVEHNGTIYALADTPSSNGSGLWTSNDGLAWSSLGLATVLETDNAYINQLAAGDSGLVAVGWSWDGGVSQYSYTSGKTMAWTSADGKGWAPQELVADLPEPVSKYIRWNSYPSDLAVREGTVVVLGSANQDIDYVAVEEDFFPDGLPHNLSFDGDGLYDYGSGPPVKVLDAEDLGIPGGRPLWEQPAHAVGWVSRGGGAFEQIDLGAFDGVNFYSLVATPSGFAAAGNRDQAYDVGDPELWTSADGVSWSAQPISFDRAIDYFTLHVWGDNLLSVASGSNGRSTLFISSDAKTWQPVTGAAFETDDDRSIQVSQVFAGPLGLVTVGEVYRILEVADVTVRSGGRHMIIDQTNYPDPYVTIVEDESGEVLFEGEMDDEEVFRFGGESLTATIEDPETSEILFEYTPADLDAARAEVEPEFIGDYEQSAMSLLYSLDGKRWNRESFDDLLGFTGYAGSAVILDDRVVLTVDGEYSGTRMFVGILEG